ncbi:hypothetical protein G5714_013843 [Onychostoma macrolepis]|uniref:Uncharacterized protein n=1 Tax=Onychostoma macrolepis TaxID=369639 RepID=A0A7J6CGC0_9TELE|nr:hypothetical protein G5714_013843 [Onychostoma macrolepis]
MGKSRRPWDGKVSLSGWEALADARREHNTHCVGRVSVASVGLEKVRLSGRECAHRRPAGDQGSRCRTGKDRKDSQYLSVSPVWSGSADGE